MRILNGAACINYANARGFLLGHLLITFSHPLVKLGVLFVKRAQQSANWARTLARSRVLGVEIKNNREVRFQPIGCEIVEFFNHHQIETAPVTLKRNGRISVAIRDHDATHFKRGTYQLGDVLRARRDIEQQFGTRGDVRSSIRHHQLAYAFADRGAAGLARDYNVEPPASEFLGEQVALRALTATVYAFKSDEQTAHWIRVCVTVFPNYLGCQEAARDVKEVVFRGQCLKTFPELPPTWPEAEPPAQPGSVRDQKSSAGCNENRGRLRAATIRWK
jgi:hypothetical protein